MVIFLELDGNRVSFICQTTIADHTRHVSQRGSDEIPRRWYQDQYFLANIFLDNFLDRPLCKAGFTHFQHLWLYSVTDIAMYFSFCPSVIVREHLACREECINVLCNDKYLNNFWTTKHFWTIFGRYFLLALDFGLDTLWKRPNLTPLVLTRGVNRSPKIMDLRKSPSRIWTVISECEPVTYRKIFGQVTSHRKFMHFLTL